MRQRLCRVCGEWHELDSWPMECVPEQSTASSAFPAPRLISDNLDYVQSMLDGQRYTSKSKLRSTYRAAGVEEVGNSPMKKQERPPSDRAGIRNELRRTFSEAKQRA